MISGRLYLALMITIVAMSGMIKIAKCGFGNGGFESGTFQNWVVEYSTYKGWKNCGTKGENPNFSNWKSSASWQNAEVLTTYTLPNGEVVAPTEGLRMAKIGDLVGETHATRLSQTITLTGNEANWSTVSLNWAALMIDGYHICQEQPFFMVEVEVRRPSNPFKLSMQWERLDRVRITSSDAAQTGSGWAFSGFTNSSATYFKRGTIQIPFNNSYPPGTELRVAITIAGCAIGAHGSLAFFDNVRIDSLCDLACLSPGAKQTIGDQAPTWIPNAFTPNGDGLNDIWNISGVTFVIKAQCTILDRWGSVIHTVFHDAPISQPFSYATLPMWDGKMNGKPVQQGVYNYIIHLSNCNHSRTYNGKVTLVR